MAVTATATTIMAITGPLCYILLCERIAISLLFFTLLKLNLTTVSQFPKCKVLKVLSMTELFYKLNLGELVSAFRVALFRMSLLYSEYNLLCGQSPVLNDFK